MAGSQIESRDYRGYTPLAHASREVMHVLWVPYQHSKDKRGNVPPGTPLARTHCRDAEDARVLVLALWREEGRFLSTMCHRWPIAEQATEENTRFSLPLFRTSKL